MLNTYLNFDGNCREAFDFYRSVFGGEFMILQTFGDAPSEYQPPEGEQDKVMHVSFPIGDNILMGSDYSVEYGADARTRQQLLHQRQPGRAASAPSRCSTRCQMAARLRCRCRICSGDRTSALAPTSSASIGRLISRGRSPSLTQALGNPKENHYGRKAP